MQKILRPIALSLVLLAPLVVQSQQAFDPGVAKPKVPGDYYVGAEKAVYHVTQDADEKGYLAILGNLRNHHNALVATGVTPELKVVINGSGIRMLTLAQELEFEANARLPGAIKEAKARGVQFEVCYNTLTGRKIKFSDLYDAKSEDIIPAGVAEVARLQRMGYAMIKP
ncbi:MAG TPA: DsrE family protein [Rhodocyclaceae bacterium]